MTKKKKNGVTIKIPQWMFDFGNWLKEKIFNKKIAKGIGGGLLLVVILLGLSVKVKCNGCSPSDAEFDCGYVPPEPEDVRKILKR